MRQHRCVIPFNCILFLIEMLQSSKMFDFKIWGFCTGFQRAESAEMGLVLVSHFFFFFNLFNFKFSRVIMNDKRGVFTEVVK